MSLMMIMFPVQWQTSGDVPNVCNIWNESRL